MTDRSTKPAVAVLHDAGEVLDLVRALRPPGGMPCGTLVVPSARVAQTLRKTAMPDVGATLAGWRLLVPIDAAIDVLGTAGQPASRPRDQRLALQLEALFASRGVGGLEYFEPDQLARGAGYAHAFAGTILGLAAAGWTARRLADVEAGADHGPRLHDVARVWAAAAEADDAPSRAAIFTRAARLLRGGQAWWPGCGPIVALLVWPEPVELAFLAALPDVRAAVIRGRPDRPEYHAVLRKIESLFGDADLPGRIAARGSSAMPPGARGAAPAAGRREIDLLQAFLFEPPDPGRPRSDGPDGSVHFEIHAGVEEEVEAAVDWIAAEVFTQHTALEEMAVLLTEADPYAGMLVERLRALPWTEASPPVYVANGLPLHRGALACGVHAVLEALDRHLSAEALHALLPHLKPQQRAGLKPAPTALSTESGHCRYPLSFALAGELVYACGTPGGLPGREELGLVWADTFQRRAAQARERISRSRGADDAEEGREVRNRQREEMLLDCIAGLLPAVTDLVELFRLMQAARPLSELIAGLRAFIGQHLHAAGARPDERQLIDSELKAMLAAAPAGGLAGRAALRAGGRCLGELRRSHGEVGDGRIFIGTLDRAVGMRFDAVRIMGLTEGTVPPAPQEDAVLPEAAARALGLCSDRAAAAGAGGAGPDPDGFPPRPDGTAVRIVRRIHEFVAAVNGARRRLVLSAGRQAIDGQIREPASVFLEAAMAVGRGTQAVPTEGVIDAQYFALGAEALRKWRQEAPLTARVVERAVARGGWSRCGGVGDELRGVPGQWIAPGPLDARRLRALHQRRLEPLTLPGGIADQRLPGLTAVRPISQSRLKHLLQCPLRFLLEDVLGWRELFEAPSMHEIDALQYGTLLHRVMQRFSERHGALFCEQLQAQRWLPVVEHLASEEFAEFVQEYPLLGEDVERRERQRLLGDARKLVLMDIERGPGRLLAAEWHFGFDKSVALSVSAEDDGALFVRGIVDRIEARDGRGLEVWDIKSGQLRRPQEPYDFDQDAQLALYAAALLKAQLPEGWPAAVARVGLISPREKGLGMRSYEGEAVGTLLQTGRVWWGLARQLLDQRLFPHAIDKEACTFCHFKEVCGEQRSAQTLAVLQVVVDPVLKAFVEFAGPRRKR